MIDSFMRRCLLFDAYAAFVFIDRVLFFIVLYLFCMGRKHYADVRSIGSMNCLLMNELLSRGVTSWENRTVALVVTASLCF
jgi:hypothetical protein